MLDHSKYIILIFITTFLFGKFIYCTYSQVSTDSTLKNGKIECSKGILVEKNIDVKVDKQIIPNLYVDILNLVNTSLSKSVYIEIKSDSYSNHTIHILDCNLSI
ncbi:MAG: hypothetical protein ACP5P3_03620 [Ignavibacteria bacterium]